MGSEVNEKQLITAESIRNGLFLAPSRTYGEKYIEPFIRYKYGLNRAQNASYDAESRSGIKYEIKACKVMKSIRAIQEKNNFLSEQIAYQNNNLATNRIFPFSQAKQKDYDANVQNVKRDHFDYLIYVLLFADCIKVFEIKKELISTIPGWSDKHGRYDALGKSGQFSINSKRIQYHISHYLKDTISYEEMKGAYGHLTEAS